MFLSNWRNTEKQTTRIDDRHQFQLTDWPKRRQLTKLQQSTNIDDKQL